MSLFQDLEEFFRNQEESYDDYQYFQSRLKDDSQIVYQILEEPPTSSKTLNARLLWIQNMLLKSSGEEEDLVLLHQSLRYLQSNSFFESSQQCSILGYFIYLLSKIRRNQIQVISYEKWCMCVQAERQKQHLDKLKILNSKKYDSCGQLFYYYKAFFDSLDSLSPRCVLNDQVLDLLSDFKTEVLDVTSPKEDALLDLFLLGKLELMPLENQYWGEDEDEDIVEPDQFSSEFLEELTELSEHLKNLESSEARFLEYSEAQEEYLYQMLLLCEDVLDKYKE